MTGTNYLAGAHVDYLNLFRIIFFGLWPFWAVLVLVILVRLAFQQKRGYSRRRNRY
jgi:hypothetical protein